MKIAQSYIIPCCFSRARARSRESCWLDVMLNNRFVFLSLTKSQICVGIFFFLALFFFFLICNFSLFFSFFSCVYSLAEEKKAEGNAYYKLKDYRKALACYTRAIELCPDSVAYYGNRAACRMMMGSYQDALEDARESTRLDSSFAKGYVRIAKCCLALGDTAAALNAINKAEELDPNSDLANEKRSLHVLQQLGEEMSKANAKGDYRKVIPAKLLH